MNADRIRLSAAVLISVAIHGAIASFGGFSGGGASRSVIVSPVAVTISSISETAVEEPVEAVIPPKPQRNPQSPDSTKIPIEPVKPEVAVSENAVPVQQAAEPLPKTETTTDEALEKPPTPKTEPDLANPIDDISSTSVTQTTSSSGATDLQDLGLAAVAMVVPAAEIPDVTAVPLYHLIPKPRYPSRSRDLGEEGLVIVAVLVSEDGSVLKAYVSKSSGFPLLDGSAVATVTKKWRFKPGTRRGSAVSSWVRVPIKFSISGG